MRLLRIHYWLLLGALGTGCAWAQLPAGTIATVNGVPLSQNTLDRLVQSSVAQGQKDNAQLRQSLKNELIARELFVQEAQRRGLDKSETAQETLAALRQNLLIELLLNDHLTQKPITEAELKTEYDRQAGLLRGAEQYLVRNIVVATESEAKAVIASLRGGADFAKTASEKSLHASKTQGGNLGWLVSSDIVAPVAQAIAKLSKGGLTATPINVDGLWHVVQLDDKRPFQVPPMAESLPQLRQALVQQRRSQLLEQVGKAASIQQ